MTNSDYDLTKRKEAAGMSGKELLQAVIDGRLPQIPIAETMSFRLVEVGDGFAVFEGDPGPHVLNPTGSVHGGWALTLIDSATACAAHTLLPAGSLYTTIETKGNLSCPITLETANEVLQTGEADAVAFGKFFIANPDLPHRFQLDAPLNDPHPETFFAPGPAGYTDYPTVLPDLLKPTHR